MIDPAGPPTSAVGGQEEVVAGGIERDGAEPAERRRKSSETESRTMFTKRR